MALAIEIEGDSRETMSKETTIGVLVEIEEDFNTEVATIEVVAEILEEEDVEVMTMAIIMTEGHLLEDNGRTIEMKETTSHMVIDHMRIAVTEEETELLLLEAKAPETTDKMMVALKHINPPEITAMMSLTEGLMTKGT